VPAECSRGILRTAGGVASTPSSAALLPRDRMRTCYCLLQFIEFIYATYRVRQQNKKLYISTNIADFKLNLQLFAEENLGYKLVCSNFVIISV